MIKYNAVVNISADLAIGTTVVGGQSKLYFRSGQDISNKRIIGISVTPTVNGDATLYIDTYLTLINKKGEYIIWNYPVVPLCVGNNTLFSATRITRTDIENIDILSSYYTIGGGFTVTSSIPWFYLNLYY